MTGRKHILLLPFPAFGHLNPMLELAKRLTHETDFTFTAAVYKEFLDSPKCRYLTDNLHNPSINFIPVCEEVAANQNPNIWFAKLNEGLTAFLTSIYNQSEGRFVLQERGAVDAIIADTFLSKPIGFCVDKNVPAYLFVAGAARGFLLKALLYDRCPLDVDSNQEWVLWNAPEDSTQALAPREQSIMGATRNTAPKVTGIIINTVAEIEAETIRTIKSIDGMHQPKLYTVGPLVPDEDKQTGGPETDQIFDWLERQKDNSVVFVSFGTLATLPPKQLQQLAEGLIRSGFPFIWSLPENLHHHLHINLKSPVDGTQAKFLIRSWVPQKAILNRSEKIALFLSHCGWNSTVEALSNGVRVLGWPIFADQGMNADYIEQFGVGIKVKGTGVNSERIVSSDEVADLIRQVQADGEKLEKAKEWKARLQHALSESGSSQQSLLELRNHIGSSV